MPFNPRAHEGTTGDSRSCHARTNLSIHVPTRARLRQSLQLRNGLILSIHVPTRARRVDHVHLLHGRLLSIHVPTRARLASPDGRRPAPSFNPRAHEGTTTIMPHCCSGSELSIHVPTRARRRRMIPLTTAGNFQSTCPRGHDRLVSQPGRVLVHFQSTCPRGRDISSLARYQVNLFFQSTCPRGHDDHSAWDVIYLDDLSIHVPTRARRKGPKIALGYRGFQSTCPRGHDTHPLPGACEQRAFNPRAHEGTTRTAFALKLIEGLSIHVPTRARPASPASAML